MRLPAGSECSALLEPSQVLGMSGAGLSSPPLSVFGLDGWERKGLTLGFPPSLGLGGGGSVRQLQPTGMGWGLLGIYAPPHPAGCFCFGQLVGWGKGGERGNYG